LPAKRRSALPSTAFAIPSKRLYPINTKSRARAALAYASRPNTRGSYSTVRKAVLKRYPSLKGKAAPGSVSTATKRGTSRKRVRRTTK
jgi:hypothetical protein